MVSVRLDKWLHVARAFRTRTQASRACALGRVLVNGDRAKPHRAVAVGDTIEIELGEWRRVLVVTGVASRPLAKAAAAELYDDRSPPRPEADAAARQRRRPPARREPGQGRPTKKERREIDRWRRG